MVTFAEFRDYDPSEYGTAAGVWQRVSGHLQERAKDVDGHVNAVADWHGTAADAARQELKTTTTERSWRAVPSCLPQAAYRNRRRHPERLRPSQNQSTPTCWPTG